LTPLQSPSFFLGALKFFPMAASSSFSHGRPEISPVPSLFIFLPAAASPSPPCAAPFLHGRPLLFPAPSSLYPASPIFSMENQQRAPFLAVSCGARRLFGKMRSKLRVAAARRDAAVCLLFCAAPSATLSKPVVRNPCCPCCYYIFIFGAR
jgi:hypothetical protein